MNTVQKIRMEQDYKEMLNMKGRLLDWEIVTGVPNAVTEYELKVNIRSIIAPGPQYRMKHILKLTIPPNYPLDKPQCRMISAPVIFHPNWWKAGNWCEGSWNQTESLGTYVVRMLRTIQYDLHITNPNSPANSEANRWFLNNKNLLPCDKQVLPDPSGGPDKSFKVQGIKKFNIN